MPAPDFVKNLFTQKPQNFQLESLWEEGQHQAQGPSKGSRSHFLLNVVCTGMTGGSCPAHSPVCAKSTCGEGQLHHKVFSPMPRKQMKKWTLVLGFKTDLIYFYYCVTIDIETLSSLVSSFPVVEKCHSLSPSTVPWQTKCQYWDSSYSLDSGSNPAFSSPALCRPPLQTVLLQ